MKRATVCLATPLRGLANYEKTARPGETEPENSYHGYRHAVRLLEYFDKIVFHNVVMQRSGAEIALRECSMAEWWRHAAKAEIVIGYSLHGAAIGLVVRLINGRGSYGLITFSHPSPGGARLRRLGKFALNRLGEVAASWIGHFSPSYARQVCGSALGATTVRRQFVAPVTVDGDYFARKELRGERRSALALAKKYLLIVGDSTRDDEFMYAALAQVSLPVIRVTRDPMVKKKVGRLMMSGRGDRLAVGIPFVELAELYREAVAAIYVSSFDAWQPAGATSIGECLACGCVPVAEGGGVIEFDYTFYAQAAPPLACPIRFFAKRDPAGLVTVLRELERLNDIEATAARERCASWARQKLDLNLSWEKFAHVFAHTVSDECVY